ncbi:MAG: hypothetical protein ACTH0C_12740 [Actinomycetaceae bacterium]
MTRKAIQDRNASYDLKAVKGQKVVANREITRNMRTKPVVIAKGETVTVVSSFDAGFNGVDLAVRKADGTFVPGITAAAFL